MTAVRPIEWDDPCPPWTAADVAQSIPECFARRARLNVADLAVSGSRWRPTYGELDAVTNGIARELCQRSSIEGARVALLMRHDAPLIAAALAVLKAGKIVVALDPADPSSRLSRIKEDADPEIIIVNAAHRDAARLAGFCDGEILCFDEPSGFAVADFDFPTVSPDAAAFLVYTSGSTDGPKGVVQTHRHILRTVRGFTNGLGYRATDRFALFASLGWGQGVATTWTALLNGAGLFPFPVMTRAVTGLSAWLVENRITVFISSPSLLRSLVRTLREGERFPALRIVRTGSESVACRDVEDFRPFLEESCAFVNGFSCSEAGNITQFITGMNALPSSGMLPIGRPAEGVEVLLLDANGAEVAQGETGEITVRTDFALGGYWNDPGLTASRFGREVAQHEGWIFRTGDLARRLEDGTLVFAGRRDTRVKVNGHRVELLEVEEACLRLPGVASAAVCVSRAASFDGKLTAFVVPRIGKQLSVAELRSALSAALPNRMLPAVFAMVADLPLTANGKVDRQRLAEMIPSCLIAQVPPDADSMTETEAKLAAIWAMALKIESVDRLHDFFELGGDSLNAAVIAAEVSHEMHVQVDLGDFWRHPTVADLARRIDALRAGETRNGRPPLRRVPRTGPMPLSFAQERIWQYARMPGSARGYVKLAAERIVGELDADALRRGLQLLVSRHEILRTTFGERDGRPVQIIHPAWTVELPLIDLAGDPEPEARAGDILAKDAEHVPDMERLPLIRWSLLRIGKNHHWLMRSHHAIISDGWSGELFFRELARIYEGYLSGEVAPGTADVDRDLQYADFAAWQRECFRPGSAAYRAEIEWWTRVLQPAVPPLVLPFRRPESLSEADPSDGRVRMNLSEDLARSIAGVCAGNGVTAYMIGLAVFSAQVAIESGQREMLLGFYSSNRPGVELQKMLGVFIDFSVHKLNFSRDSDLQTWLQEVRRTVIEAKAHSEIPYEQVCAEMDLAGISRHDVRVIFGTSDPKPPLRLGRAEMSGAVSRAGSMPWGFSVSLTLIGGKFVCQASFDARIHDPAGARAFLDRFGRLLALACAEPERDLLELWRRARHPEASIQSTSSNLASDPTPIRPL